MGCGARGVQQLSEHWRSHPPSTHEIPLTKWTKEQTVHLQTLFLQGLKQQPAAVWEAALSWLVWPHGVTCPVPCFVSTVTNPGDSEASSTKDGPGESPQSFFQKPQFLRLDLPLIFALWIFSGPFSPLTKRIRFPVTQTMREGFPPGHEAKRTNLKSDNQPHLLPSSRSVWKKTSSSTLRPLCWKRKHWIHTGMSLQTVFPSDSVIKDWPANAGDMSLIPGSGRSPGEGNGDPLQYYSCLKNPMNRGAGPATVYRLPKESDMT